MRIDRPLGSHHPRWGFRYPVNYGFVPGVAGADGEELDAYVLGVTKPLESFTGQCIAVIHRPGDEDKLVLAPPGTAYTAAQIATITAFQEQFFDSLIRLAPHKGDQEQRS